MTDPENPTARSLLPTALAAFGERVHAVPADRWDSPTPCEGWTVRDLVAHLVGEHLWAVPLLSGETVEEVGDRFDGHELGDDPVNAWDAAADTSEQAWGLVTDGRQVVHLSAGDTPAEEYAHQMLTDLTVHGWDLARGAGLDERLPGAPVGVSLAWAQANRDTLAGSGLFGDEVATDSEDPQDRLLALLGRRR